MNHDWAPLRTLHRYLGVSVGVVFTVTGLSGSSLVFYPAIDRLMNPSVRAIPDDARPASHEAVYQALLRSHPDRSRGWRIEVPDGGGAIAARSLSDDDLAGRSFAPVIAWVDPRAYVVVRSEQWGRFPVTWLYDLHYRLRLGPTGARIMGIIGIQASPSRAERMFKCRPTRTSDSEPCDGPGPLPCSIRTSGWWCTAATRRP